MKRRFFLLMLTLMLVTFTYAVAEEINEEYIQQYGILSNDENGNEIILIPLKQIDLLSVKSEINEETCGCYENLMLRHSHPLEHTHKMENIVVTRNLLKSKPLTDWADEGFILSYQVSEAIEMSLQVNLAGGISKGAVEANLGVSIGGTYTYGVATSYTAPAIPEGYKGRISFKMNFDYYTFDDVATYIVPTEAWNPEPYWEDVVVTRDSTEANGRNGMIYLELSRK